MIIYLISQYLLQYDAIYFCKKVHSELSNKKFSDINLTVLRNVNYFFFIKGEGILFKSM